MIKKVLLVLCLLASPNLWATTTPWMNSYLLNPSTSTTNFALPKGAYQAEGTEANAYGVAPTSITLRNLKVIVSTAPDNGAGTQSWTIHFRVEGAASSPDFSCVISEASTTCSDGSTTVALTAGQRIDWSIVPSGTPAATRMAIYVEATTSNGETVLVGNSRGNLGTGATTYGATNGAGNGGETSVWNVYPSAGTVKKLYTYLETATGSGTSRTVMLRQNQAGTALATTYSNAGGVASDTSDTVTIVAGDALAFQWSLTGTPTNSAAEWGAVFVPTVDGDFAVFAGNINNQSNSVNGYFPFSGGVNQSNATSDSTPSLQNVVLSGSFYISGLYVKLSIGPNNGAGTQSITASLRANGADASRTFAVTISEAAVSGCTNNGGTGGCSDSGGTFTPSVNDQLDTQFAPSGTPVTNMKASFAYLAHSTLTAAAAAAKSLSSTGAGH